MTKQHTLAPAGEGPAPVARRGRVRGRFGRLGCLVVAVAVGLVAVVGIGTERIERVFDSPERSVARFLSVVDGGNLRAGYDDLCAEYRRVTSEGEFAAELRRQREGLGPSGATVRDSFPRGLDRFSVYVTLKGTARSRTVELTVVREDWAWRVCGFDWS